MELTPEQEVEKQVAKDKWFNDRGNLKGFGLAYSQILKKKTRQAAEEKSNTAKVVSHQSTHEPVKHNEVVTFGIIKVASGFSPVQIITRGDVVVSTTTFEAEAKDSAIARLRTMIVMDVLEK